MTTTPTDTEPEVREVKRVHPLAQCEVCPLYGRGVALSQGPTGVNAKAAIVSRSPGYHDVNAGRPFAGPSGDVLDFLLQQQGIKREEVLVTNVVLCSPTEGKVPPKAIEACAPRLVEELQGVGNIVAAGAEAVNSLVGRGTIDHYRGYRIKRGHRTFVATNNPALVLRDDSTFPNLVKDFRRAFNPLPEPTMPKVELIEDATVAKRWFKEMGQRTGFVGADIESRGGLTHKAHLVSLQFSFSGTLATVFGERSGLFQDEDFIRNYLRPFLESTDRRYIWHNGIFDTKILRHTYGINARVDEDTLLLSYATDERGGVHDLEYLLMEEFGWPYYAPASVNSFKKTGKLVSDKEDVDLRKEYKDDEAKYERAFKQLEERNYFALYKYAGYDCAGTFQLFELLRERAKAEGVFERPYKSTLLESNEVIHAMETTGMPYDYQKASEVLETDVQPELDKIVSDLQKLTGKELLKPSSPQQMAALYYDEWEILHTMRYRPDKARSVDDSARKEITEGRFNFGGEWSAVQEGNKMKRVLADNALSKRQLIIQVAGLHDRFQKLNKQAGTYLKGLIERAEEDEESRIYTSLLRHGTTSSRLASRGPNLQNVTRTKEGLPDIRGLFFAHEGTLLVQADYSQAELRTIAALSGDKLLTKVYMDDEDLHNVTATRFYGEGFTNEQRQTSKNVNFGGFYGQSPASFQEKHDIPEAEAEEYIEWMWNTFVGVKAWAAEVRKLVHKQKYGPRSYNYVESPFGHRRRFWLITQENRGAIYREAINFLPQNIASNLTLHSSIKLHEAVDKQQARICLSVHDSILAQVREEYVPTYKKLCEEIMVGMPEIMLGWKIPFKIDIGAGKTWATAK